MLNPMKQPRPSIPSRAPWAILLGCSLTLGCLSNDGGPNPDCVDEACNDDPDPDDTDDPVLPTEFRGVPQRPFADVETPATGDLEVGATSCIGTPENPAFIVGDGTEFAPEDSKYELTVAENCIIANINLRGRLLIRNSNNVEVRDSEIHHSSGAGISGGASSVAIINTHIHHNTGNNGHAVVMGCGSSKIWVGHNLLEYNDEDGFQATCAKTIRPTKSTSSETRVSEAENIIGATVNYRSGDNGTVDNATSAADVGSAFEASFGRRP